MTLETEGTLTDDQKRMIEAIVKMGRTVGQTPDDWAVMLMTASKIMQIQLGMNVEIGIETKENCNCSKCKAVREAEKRSHLEVVKPEDML